MDCGEPPFPHLMLSVVVKGEIGGGGQGGIAQPTLTEPGTWAFNTLFAPCLSLESDCYRLVVQLSLDA